MRSLLRHDPDYCHGCPLFRDTSHKTTYVPTDVVYHETAEDGETPQVDILFVGEAPNHIEDMAGVSFAGDTGDEIRSALRKVGLEHSFALANVVRCRPRDETGNNRAPTVEEVAACSHYTRQDIEKLNPKVVVLVGNLAVQTLTPNPEWKGKGAGKLKGQIYQKDGRTHLVTVNPSSYLRSNSGPEKRRFYRHISSAASFLTGETNQWSEKGTVVLIDTLEKFDKALNFFLHECTNPVAVDSETKNLNRVADNKVATIQLSASAELSYVFPIDHWDSPFKTKEEKRHIKRGLKKLFSSTTTKFPFWIAHNSQFDTAIILRHFRIARIAKRIVDTQFLAFLQDENQVGSEDGGKSEFNTFRLKDLARELLGFYYYDTDLSDAIAARHGADGGSLWNLSLDRLSEYGGTDAYVTFRLFYYYRRWLTRQGYDTALKFALRWYGRVSHLLTKMSMNGFQADPVQLKYLLSDKSPILSRLEELPKLIYATPQAKKANDILLSADPRTKGMRPLFGKKPWVLNVDKKKDRVHLFVDSCGLKALSEGKDGTASLNKAYFEEYKAHPIIQMYHEYSGLYKLRSSYLNSIDKILYSNPDNAADGRIHAGFHALRTVTGRLSCLPEGTPIATDRGVIPIEDVEERDHVQTSEGPQEVSEEVFSGIGDVYRFNLDNGRHLDCTLPHRVLVNGKWAEADSIQVGDKLSISGVPGPEVSKIELSTSLDPSFYFDKSIPDRLAYLRRIFGVTGFFESIGKRLADNVSTLLASVGVHHSLKESETGFSIELLSSLSSDSSIVLASVTDIVELGPKKVYDITVPFSSSFLVNGINVHNSSNPNLQQLPKGNPWTAKAAIRSMYAARPGYILVECDYGQAEVRWWAQISGDHQYANLFKEMKALREEYKRTGDKELGKKVKAEADIHKKVASIMFKKSVYDVTKDERQRAKALCVVKGTWVRTDLGLERIEDVVARFNGTQRLETREGAENATKTWHLQVPKTYTLKTSRGYELSGRPEHPVLVWRETKLAWVELQHLLSTDHVVIRRDATLWPSKEVQLHPYVWARNGQSGYMPEACLYPTSLTPDLGRLCGYLTAEADCTNEANIQFVNKNENIVHDFERILTENFGTGFSKILNDDGCWAITLNASISRFLRENSLADIATSHTKQIPTAVLKSPRNVLSEYIRGYWAGDGCTGSACRALTASSDLAHQLQMVLLDLGVVTTRSMSHRVTSVGEGDYWTVAATGKDASHFMEMLSPLREGTFVQPKWFSSNIDHIPGLQTKIRAFRKDNPYLKGTNRKYSGQRTYPALPWTGAKEISTSFARENQEALLLGLQSRDSVLAKDVSEIISKNWYLDSIEAIDLVLKENQEVYDFTIPGSHSFVSQGLISHNCFGCIFGQASQTLAAILGISHEEAIELQDLFIQEFEKAGRWLTDIETQARLTGIVTTPFGRRRHLADLYEIDDGAGNRRARNSPIQASSSDTTALAAWRIQSWIEDNNRPYNVINCVHDAITMEIPMDFDMVKETVALFSEMMVDSIPSFLKQEFNIDMIVPMEIDFDLGVRWGHMLGYDGVESSLRPIFDKCEAWDKELAAGTPWNVIALRESCFQDPEKAAVSA